MKNRTFILGDVHGEYDLFEKILLHIGIVHKACDNIHWNKGCHDTLIQVGDMIDGGSESVRCYNTLKRLQEEASVCGGEVVRLLGNHELGYISTKKCTGMEKRTDMLLSADIRQDVLNGTLKPWHVLPGHLITHGGIVNNTLFMKFNLLKDAVNSNDWANESFNVGASRGGKFDYGGIFWADYYSDLIPNEENLKFNQIVGHTAIRSRGTSSFEKSPLGKIINVDCGISRHAGGYVGITEYLGINKFKSIMVGGEK